MFEQTAPLISRIHDDLLDRARHGSINARAVPTGEILFLFEYFKRTGNASTFATFASILNTCLEAHKPAQTLLLLDGFPGLVSVLQHDPQFAAQPIFRRIQSAALADLAALKSSAECNGLDFFTGQIGYCYLTSQLGNLEMVRHVTGAFLRMVERVVDSEFDPLCQTIRPEGWPDAGKAVVDLGLPHGNLGIITTLALIARDHPPLEDSTRPVFTGMLDALLDLRKEDDVSYFPYFAGQMPQSRIGWCYGDLSVLVALVHGHRCAPNARWATTIHDILARIESRFEQGESLENVFVCHGGAGVLAVLHLLQRHGFGVSEKLYNLVATRTFKAAQAALEDLNETPTDLLNGTSGLGLSLMASAEHNVLPWARLLQL